MHIRNDPSFFLTNKTGAPQGEELGLIKPFTRYQIDLKFPLALVEYPQSSEIPQDVLNYLGLHQLLPFDLSSAFFRVTCARKIGNPPANTLCLSRDDVQSGLVTIVASVTMKN
ncbi:hypothetical protein Tco_1146026 [Tanacetum coccineum]